MLVRHTPAAGGSVSTSHHDRGRRAYERREWRAAWESLARADEEAPLDAVDLGRLADAAYLIGRDEDFMAALERQHRLLEGAGDAAGAARAAFRIGFHLADRGEMARATGWFGRAARLLDQAGGEHVERGYLLLPSGLQRFSAGDHDTAARIGAEAAEIAQRFGDRDLLALALHMRGRALVAGGEVEAGLALLDEAMVAVAGDELSPHVTGLIYCSVIGACRSVYALGRAREWTAALADWCERQPDMVAYSGECRVYRAELFQLNGAWAEALAEARRAGERLVDNSGPTAALAHYQQGEVHRLLGQFDAAEAAYRAASLAGREPQPGLSLLRLAQGDDDAAAAASRRAVAETTSPLARARILPAHVQIMLAVDDMEEARRACAELEDLSGRYRSAALDAMLRHARGAVSLAAGDPRAALPDLREACREWHALGAPYDVARARLLLGLACRELGDDDGAALELDAARAAFERLGARPDVAVVDAMLAGAGASGGSAAGGAGGGAGGGNPSPGAGRAHGLTPRELEVLALVATGRTNRAIADHLYISEKTVARHLSNIFTKLGLASRAAATAYAYENDLVRPSA
jgi:DNA-binding CsgD family transcriptional regulator